METKERQQEGGNKGLSEIIQEFKPVFIQVADGIRRKQTKIKEGSQSRFKFQLWKSRAFRRQDKSEHFSNQA